MMKISQLNLSEEEIEEVIFDYVMDKNLNDLWLFLGFVKGRFNFLETENNIRLGMCCLFEKEIIIEV